MNVTILFLFFVPLSVMSWGIYLAYKYTRPRKLRQKQVYFFMGHYKKILKNQDQKSVIIELDKMYHKILVCAWYKWDFWTILKNFPKEVDDINRIWYLHKLRNKLVHDFDIFDENFLKEKGDEYKKMVKILLDKVS